MSYKILGINDEQTCCDLCGKNNLKKTVILENEHGTIRVGVDCAELLLKKSGKNKSAVKIKLEANAAQNKINADKKWQDEQYNRKISYRIAANMTRAMAGYCKNYPRDSINWVMPKMYKNEINKTFCAIHPDPVFSERRLEEYLIKNNYQLVTGLNF